MTGATALPPGPRLPALVQGLWFIGRPVHCFDYCQRRFGDAFTLHIPSMPPAVFVSDPAAIRDVFTGDAETFYAGEANVVLRPIVGPNSLLQLDGARHLRERRMMLPPFHGERMRAYAAVMREVTEQAVARWPIGRPFPLMRETQAITLDVIVRTVFGVTGAEAMTALSERLRRFMTMAVSPLSLWRPLQVNLGRHSPWGRFLHVRREVDAQLDAEIAARRAAGNPERDDVLSLLLAARDEQGAPMTDAEIRDELMTLLLAGHETTATSLAWTVQRMLSEPGVYERARAEVASVAGAGGVNDDDVAKLEYLDAVIKETMRLNPVLSDVMRIVKRPTRVGSIDLPEGTGVVPNIYGAHRRATTWPEPERFLPDRFIGRRLNPYEYFPFGGGLRRCLGQAFALHEMRIVLATLLSRTELALAPGYRVRVTRRNITWVPSEGMPVVLTRRAA